MTICIKWGYCQNVVDCEASDETLRNIVDEISKTFGERRLGKRSKNRSNLIEVFDEDLAQRTRMESRASDSS